MSFPLPREYDAERLNAFHASEAPPPPSLLLRVELYRNLCYRFTLSFPARWQNMPGQQRQVEATFALLQYQSIGNEAWEFSNAAKRRLLWQGYREPGVSHSSFPCTNMGGRWLNFLMNTPHHLCYDLFIPFCSRACLFQLLLSIRVCIFNRHILVTSMMCH